MNLNKFRDNFNINISKLNKELIIKEINETEDRCKVLKINEDISSVSYEVDNKLTGITIIAAGKTNQETINILSVISIAIDTFTEQNREWRNNILTRLGMFNGSFIKGKKTESRGYKFKISPANNKIVLAISKI
ncbi:hypothetical protein [uncultured Clostridium sp.]|uniref:hypothetical protein n=1 Tax=uncultured Clostridium sp. TaxID=59620 RepID=UPI0028EC0721|nr:hypothetical protein [uncultured Clostridium sp.]